MPGTDAIDSLGFLHLKIKETHEGLYALHENFSILAAEKPSIDTLCIHAEAYEFVR